MALIRLPHTLTHFLLHCPRYPLYTIHEASLTKLHIHRPRLAALPGSGALSPGIAFQVPEAPRKIHLVWANPPLPSFSPLPEKRRPPSLMLSARRWWILSLQRRSFMRCIWAMRLWYRNGQLGGRWLMNSTRATHQTSPWQWGGWSGRGNTQRIGKRVCVHFDCVYEATGFVVL